MEMPINLTVSVPGQVPNWDLLADLLTAAGTSIRSFSQVGPVCLCSVSLIQKYITNKI